MTRVRAAGGGGRVVEVEPDRITGWVNRFAARNDGLASVTAALSGVLITGGSGTTAHLAVPFPPMDPAGAEPVEAVLRHTAHLGPMAVVLVRAAAFSIGVAEHGAVLASSTGTRYVQSRTAAGGWSQQRYARRRGNQLRDSHRAAADAAARVLTPAASTLCAVVGGGESGGIAEVLDDPRLAFLTALPRRTFGDIAEPRRAVLDEVARRALTVEITVRSAQI